MRSDSLPRFAPAPFAPALVPETPALLTPPPRSISTGATASPRIGSKGSSSGPSSVVGGGNPPVAAGPSSPPTESLYEPHGLFIANLPQGSTDAVLRQALNYHFSRFGTVASVKIKREKDVRPVAARKKEGDVWAWLSLATPEQATTALRGAQGIRVLGRTLRVERAKAHRIILLESRGHATFVPSAAGGWLVRTTTGDFDLAELLGGDGSKPSIETRRNGGGLLLKFGQGDGPGLLERLNANVHLSAIMYVEDHTVAAGTARRSLPAFSSSPMLQRAPNGFGSAERGRTRHRQGALATQDGRAERAKLGRPAGSPEQAWFGLRIAIPTPPRFQQISPVQQSTFGHPVDHAPAGQTTRTGAEVIDGAYGSYHNHLAPAPVDSHRPGVQPGFSPAARVTPFSEPLDSRFGSVDPSFYHHPPTPFLGLPTSPLSPFLPVHWPAYGSLPASPGIWPYRAPRPFSSVRPREDSPGWIQEPQTTDASPDAGKTSSWPGHLSLVQRLPSMLGGFFLQAGRPPPSFSGPPTDRRLMHAGFLPMPLAPPFWPDGGGFATPWHNGRHSFSEPTFPPVPGPSAPAHDWRAQADGHAYHQPSTMPSAPPPLDTFERDLLY